jgi:cell division protein FtsL
LVLPNLLDIPKSVWFMILIIFALLGSVIGVSTHIDSLQFEQIDSLNEKVHELDKQVAIGNERIEELSEPQRQPQLPLR